MALGAMRELRRVGVDAMEASRRWYPHLPRAVLPSSLFRAEAMSGPPDPKSRSLARGERRYRRKVASPKQWQAIIEAKGGPCRVCVQPSGNGHGFNIVEFHHLIARDLGGDDIEGNIVPVCRACHLLVTVLDGPTLAALAASLTDSEYAYVVGKLGESGPARLFGVGR